MTPQFHASAASPGHPWWWDEHLAACPDFHIRVSERLGTEDKRWGLMWAEGRVQVLMGLQGHALMYLGDPGPQSEGTPQTPTPYIRVVLEVSV